MIMVSFISYFELNLRLHCIHEFLQVGVWLCMKRGSGWIGK